MQKMPNELKNSKTKPTMKVKLLEVIDSAIGGAERGEVNLNVMRAFFNTIIEKQEIKTEIAFIDPDLTKLFRESDLAKIEEPPPLPSGPPKFKIINEGTPDEKKEYIDEREFSLCGRKSDIEMGCISIGSVFKGVKQMEDNSVLLNDLEDQYNLLRHLNQYENIHPTILTETWRGLRIVRQAFKNETDLAEIQMVFDKYKSKMADLRTFNDEIRRAVTELNRGMVDETGRPIFTDPFAAMKEALGKVNKVIERFPDFEALLKKVKEQVGLGTLPSLAFMDNMSSYCSIENLTNNNPICYVPFEIRKVQGDAPPTKTLMALCIKLAQMIKYNEEKMKRLKAIEVHLEHLRLKNATKKEAQKLIERMAEVDGIGTAVERLLCRIQKCEDLICGMRQVVNKVYGCITSNPTTRYESENIWACMFNQEENRPENMAENDLISDTQMKTFHSQITKIDCEAKIIERNLMNVEAVKVDVKNLFSIANELEENKLDKCVISTELAKKADRHLCDDKVSRFCFQQTCEGINAVISDILTKILDNDKECHKVISYLTGKTNVKADNDAFYSFKEQAEYKLRCLAQKLTNLHNYRRNNSLNNSNTTTTTSKLRPPNVNIGAAINSLRGNKNKHNNYQDKYAAPGNVKSKNHGNANNNSNCKDSDASDCKESSDSSDNDNYCDCTSDTDACNDEANLPLLGRFIVKLAKRSRGLMEIFESFKKINDSFRIITQSMYDYDVFRDFFATKSKDENFNHVHNSNVNNANNMDEAQSNYITDQGDSQINQIDNPTDTDDDCYLNREDEIYITSDIDAVNEKHDLFYDCNALNYLRNIEKEKESNSMASQ